MSSFSTSPAQPLPASKWMDRGRVAVRTGEGKDEPEVLRPEGFHGIVGGTVRTLKAGAQQAGNFVANVVQTGIAADGNRSGTNPLDPIVDRRIVRTRGHESAIKTLFGGRIIECFRSAHAEAGLRSPHPEAQGRRAS